MKPHSNYEVFECLGAGPDTEVHRAYDVRLRRPVAIKRLQERVASDRRRVDRFIKQAQFVAGLEHEHLIKIHALEPDAGWIVMELMAGSLETKLHEGGLTSELARSVLRQALEALAYLHGKNKIHGRIRPANILVSDDGRVKLSDFENRESGDEMPRPSGDGKCLAPELLQPEFGAAGCPLDLYCLGFAILELLAGDAFGSLFPGVGNAIDSRMAWMRWHSSPQQLPPLAELLPETPPDLGAALDLMLKKQVAERAGSARELLAILTDAPWKAVELPASRSNTAESTDRPANSADKAPAQVSARPPAPQSKPAPSKPDASKPAPSKPDASKPVSSGRPTPERATGTAGTRPGRRWTLDLNDRRTFWSVAALVMLLAVAVGLGLKTALAPTGTPQASPEVAANDAKEPPVQPVKTAPVKPEPVKPEPVKPEPVKPEPVKPEPVKPEPINPPPVKPTPVKPEPVKPTPVKPEPAKPVETAAPKPKPSIESIRIAIFPIEARQVANITVDGAELAAGDSAAVAIRPGQTTLAVRVAAAGFESVQHTFPLEGLENDELEIQLARAPETSSEHDTMAAAQREVARGLQLFAAGDVQQAELAFSQAISLAPQFRDGHVGRGGARSAAGNLEGAAEDYRNAVKIRPEATLYVLLGHALADTRKFDEALEAYREALAMDARLVTAHTGAARVYCLTGGFEKAAAAARAAVDLDPKFSPAHNLLGLALSSQGDLQGALRAFFDAVQADAANHEALYHRGRLLLQMVDKVDDDVKGLALREHAIKDLDESIRQKRRLQGAAGIDRELADVYVLRGAARASSGQTSGAIEDFAAAIELAPSPAAYENRAVLYRRLGQPAEAERDLRKARELRAAATAGA